MPTWIPNNTKDQLLTLAGFGAAGHTFKCALYTAAAGWTASNLPTTYGSTNELVASGYTAGGQALTNVANILASANSGIAAADWNNCVWNPLTATGIRYAVIYDTNRANEVVLVVDFGADQSVTADAFTVTIPSVGQTGAFRVGP